MSAAQTDLTQPAPVPRWDAPPYEWAQYFARRALLGTLEPLYTTAIAIGYVRAAHPPSHPCDETRARELLNSAYRDLRSRLDHLAATMAADARRMALAGATDHDIRHAVETRITDCDVIRAIAPDIRLAVSSARSTAARALKGHAAA